ncbi:MAG: hypothetical protein Q8J88_12830 [Bacteroidales bacterium]|nr:hypothetical protein [Bacteroidales bacterium]
MKTKYILLLFGTLIAGILIGTLTTGRVTRNKVEKIKSFNTKEGFREHLYKIMQPTEAQREQLSPILDSFSDRHWELMKQNWENQKALFDEMDIAIKPFITEEQFQLLMDHKQKTRKGREYKCNKRNEEINSKESTK